MDQGKIQATFLIDGKKSTRTFDKGKAGLSNQYPRNFVQAYQTLLESGSSIVKATYTQYQESEVVFE